MPLQFPRLHSPGSEDCAGGGDDCSCDGSTRTRTMIPAADGSDVRRDGPWCSSALQHLESYGLTWLSLRMRCCFLENHGEILERGRDKRHVAGEKTRSVVNLGRRTEHRLKI